jgi:hypothetical protein
MSSSTFLAEHVGCDPARGRKTAVAYVVFNRPRHTRETFAAIRAYRPTDLFIIADGPRPGHSTDTQRCREVRELLAEVDWPCRVHRNYADQNLGLKRRVSSGLDWVFEHVEDAIILEDDCLPHPDFFEFCTALLAKYRDDQRVSVITGNNFQDGRRRGNAAYYFSKYCHCWGWATWRRSWSLYESDLPFWPDWERSPRWRQVLPEGRERRYWSSIFNRVARHEIDSWAYPWTASVWYRGGLTATPNTNLVTNIGFGPDGTHTVTAEDIDGIPSGALGALTHPLRVEQDHEADGYVFEHTFGGREQRAHRRLLSLARRAAGKVRRLLTARRVYA